MNAGRASRYTRRADRGSNERVRLCTSEELPAEIDTTRNQFLQVNHGNHHVQQNITYSYYSCSFVFLHHLPLFYYLSYHTSTCTEYSICLHFTRVRFTSCQVRFLLTILPAPRLPQVSPHFFSTPPGLIWNDQMYLVGMTQ